MKLLRVGFSFSILYGLLTSPCHHLTATWSAQTACWRRPCHDTRTEVRVTWGGLEGEASPPAPPPGALRTLGSSPRSCSRGGRGAGRTAGAHPAAPWPGCKVQTLVTAKGGGLARRLPPASSAPHTLLPILATERLSRLLLILILLLKQKVIPYHTILIFHTRMQFG